MCMDPAVCLSEITDRFDASMHSLYYHTCQDDSFRKSMCLNKIMFMLRNLGLLQCLSCMIDDPYYKSTRNDLQDTKRPNREQHDHHLITKSPMTNDRVGCKILTCYE